MQSRVGDVAARVAEAVTQMITVIVAMVSPGRTKYSFARSSIRSDLRKLAAVSVCGGSFLSAFSERKIRCGFASHM